MNRKSSAKAVSVLKRLSNFAIAQNMPFDYVLTSFLLERLVVRLISERNLSSNLIFKGGYVGLRVYDSPRYTVDLDVLLLEIKLSDIVGIVKHSALADMSDEVWFMFENTVDLLTQGKYPGLRIVFRAGVGGKLEDIKRAKIIHLDIGVGDQVMPTKIETPYILGDGKFSWNVYAPETIVAEKLHTIVDRGSSNSRAKDIIDLNYFIPLCDRAVLEGAILLTFRTRNTRQTQKLWQIIRKLDYTVMKKGWISANEFSSTREDFDSVLERLITKLKSMDL